MATLEQERHVELVSGTTEKFLITSRMVDATIPYQLPHLNVFVLTIRDRLDPKADTLARVARISDLTALPQGRDVALATTKGINIEFLSPSTINAYSTLSEGVAAAAALKDRVNKLVQDWISFGANFNAPDPTPATYLLPLVDPTQVAALIQAYKTAKQTRYATQLAKAEADAALSRAQTAYTEAQQRLTDTDGMVTKVTDVDTKFGLTRDYFNDLLVSANAFSDVANALELYQSATGTTPGAPDPAAQASWDSSVGAFDVARDTAIPQDNLAAGYLLNASALVTQVTDYIAARTTEKNAAAAVLTNAQANQLTLAQSLTTIKATETAALAAVLVVCPDFDKRSIPFVDDTEL